MGTYAARDLIEKLARDEHKEAILDAFKRHLELAGVIRSKGWGQDALPTLREKMALELSYYPVPLIALVVDLAEVDLYPHVLAYLRDGTNRGFTAEELARAALRGDPFDPVPGLLDALSRCDDQERGQLAAARLSLGRAKALAPLLRAARAAEEEWEARRAYDALRKHVAVPGAREEFLSWMEANAEKLRWDPARKQFVP